MLLMLPAACPAHFTPADFGFDDEQRDRMLGGFIAAAFYLVGEQRAEPCT
jgi:hypothetical protein